MDSSTEVFWGIRRCPSLALSNPITAWHYRTPSNNRGSRVVYDTKIYCLWILDKFREGEKHVVGRARKGPGWRQKLGALQEKVRRGTTKGPSGRVESRGEGAKWSWCWRGHGRVSLCGTGPFPSPGTYGGFLQDAGNFPALARGELCLLSQEEKGPISSPTCCQILSVVFQNFNVWCWSLNPFIT